MDIEIKYGLEGASAAEGIVIIVDAFRAGNTVAALLGRGAPFVRPVAELDEALALRTRHPDWLLVGERGGMKPEGFEMNNSPDQAARLDMQGRPAVITTSAGTRGLKAAAPRARILLMATLVNAGPAAAMVRSRNPDRVTIVAMGTAGVERAEEDDAVAEFLAESAAGGSPDYRRTVRRMLKGAGADRLRRLGQWRDLAWCLRLNRLRLIPMVDMSEGVMVLRAAGPNTEAAFTGRGSARTKKND